MKTLLVLGIALVATVALGAAACGDADDDDGTGGAGTPAPDGRTLVAAPIDDLELIVRESAPPRYAVRIVSGLPNGCAQFFDAQVRGRSGNEIAIAVRNSLPSDPNIACTQVYGTHESTVELGSDFVSGSEYVVEANDKELRFTAQ